MVVGDGRRGGEERESKEEEKKATRKGIEEMKQVVAPPHDEENPIDASGDAVAVISVLFLHCTRRRRRRIKGCLFSWRRWMFWERSIWWKKREVGLSRWLRRCLWAGAVVADEEGQELNFQTRAFLILVIFCFLLTCTICPTPFHSGSILMSDGVFLVWHAITQIQCCNAPRFKHVSLATKPISKILSLDH